MSGVLLLPAVCIALIRTARTDANCPLKLTEDFPIQEISNKMDFIDLTV
jgi:hypothetical protein